MKKIILIIIGVIVLLAALIISLPYILSLFSKDIAPIDDSDLQVLNISLPPAEENAFYDAVDLKLSLEGVDYKTIDDIVAGKTWDEILVTKILSDNNEALDIFDRMSKKTAFQDPDFASPEKISFLSRIYGLAELRNTAKLSAVKAIKLAREGRGEDAFNEALKTLEIGQKMENSQAPLINYLVAMSLKNVGLDTIELITDLTSILPENFVRLERFKENKEWPVIAFKVEHKMGMESLYLYLAGDLDEDEFFSPVPTYMKILAKNRFYFKPNKTEKLFADNIRFHISASKKPCGSEYNIEIKQLVPESNRKLVFTENLIGRMMYDIGAVDLSSVLKRSCDIDSKILSLQDILK